METMGRRGDTEAARTNHIQLDLEPIVRFRKGRWVVHTRSITSEHCKNNVPSALLPEPAFVAS